MGQEVITMTEAAQVPAVINAPQHNSLFLDLNSFQNGQRMASLLSESKLIPSTYQKNLPDCLIALELAQRIGVSPMAVMQNTFVIHGKPGYSAQFIIAMINSCGRYSPLRFEISGEGDNRTCVAWAYELSSGEKLEGPPISIAVARKEGWYGKNGSKWQTMPELMLRYRAATFFGRMYAPELLMGMKTSDELLDGAYTNIEDDATPRVVDDLNDRFNKSGKKEPEPASNDVPKQETKEPEPQPEEQLPREETGELSTRFILLRNQMLKCSTSIGLNKWKVNNHSSIENLELHEREEMNQIFMAQLNDLEEAEK